MITKINKIPKREMTHGPKAAQLTWTSGHSSPDGAGGGPASRPMRDAGATVGQPTRPAQTSLAILQKRTLDLP